MDKLSYALGLGIGQQLAQMGAENISAEDFAQAIKDVLEGNELKVSRPSDDREFRSLHGLTRTLINNMVTGVTEGFKKELEISGVGYRAQKNGNELVLNVGYSNPVKILDTDLITTEVPNPQRIVVNGIDKQAVGQFAAEIRRVRPPEPYKGKGIHYVGEYIIRKEGKAGKA